MGGVPDPRVLAETWGPRPLGSLHPTCSCSRLSTNGALLLEGEACLTLCLVCAEPLSRSARQACAEAMACFACQLGSGTCGSFLALEGPFTGAVPKAGDSGRLPS
jgi:hypothetical protein